MSHKKKIVATQKSNKPTTSPWWEALFYPTIVAVVAFALYANTLSFDFVYHDDDTMIVNNSQTLEQATLKTVFLTDAWFQEKKIQLYRPWQSLTYVLDYKLWKTNPKGYHLHNVVVFGLSLFVLNLFLRQLRFDKRWAFLFTLFYSCHYLFAHAVCWIPARGDLYLVLFGLMTLVCFLKYFRSRSWKVLLWANVFFVLALLAKETAAVLVPVAALLRWAELKWDVKQLKSLVGLWLLPVVLVAGTYLLLRSKSIDPEGSVSLSGVFYNLPVIPESVFKFYVPSVFCVLPGYNAVLTITGVVLILVIIVVVVALRKSEGRFLMMAGLTMFLLSLLPSIFYKPTFSASAYDYLDHRMFFAGVGLLLFTGAAVTALPWKVAILQKIFLGLCVVEAGFSFNYQDAYRDYHHYYQNAISTNPKSALAMLNYGILLRERERDFQKSVDVLTMGSRAYPNSSAFLNEKAGTLFAMRDYDNMYAVAQAMSKYPDRQYEALLYTGIYFNVKGLLEPALSAYNKAIELRPRSYSTRFNRAQIYKQMNNTDAMLTDLTEAIRLNPDYADAFSERGNLYANLGHWDKALSDFDKYVVLQPEDPAGFYLRGQALVVLGRTDEGCNSLRKAAEMGLHEAMAKYKQLCN